MGSSFQRDIGQTVADDQAIERYRYMLRTAPPDAIEQAHAEAFAQLTPGQRRLVFEQLARAAPPEERPYMNEAPRTLARIATRAEIRQPGMLELLFGSVQGDRGHSGYGGGLGASGMVAGSLLGSVAESFVGSAIAHSFFAQQPFAGTPYVEGAEEQGSDVGESEQERTAEKMAVRSDRRFGDVL